MNFYPYSAPIILTDDIYTSYGGDTGNSTPAQRQAAYLLAEEKVTEDIDTFLLPTTITGVYLYNPYKYLMLDYGYVNSVGLVSFLNTKEEVYWSISGTSNIYISIRNDTYGVIDIDYLMGYCGCASIGFPYQVQVVYTTGLPTGTASDPRILMALTEYANIIVNEMIGYGNEAPGDIGVQSFTNQQYQENRKFLLRTTFGTSAKANFIRNLLSSYRKYRRVGL